MQIAGLLNGTNINQDYMLSMGLEAIISTPGAIVSGLAVTTNTVAVGKAVIRCTRTNGQVVFVSYSNTTSVTIDSSGSKKVWVEVSQSKLDDGSTNATDGTGIAVINTGTVYPVGNYMPLATISAGVITDDRAMWIKMNDKSVNIASATTTDLSTATGDEIHITGTNTITSFGILPAGIEVCLIFDGILTLTHNTTSLFLLAGGANIITAVGDTAYFRSEGSGNWRCTGYHKANGLPVVQGGSAITGEVRMWTTATPPTNWLICDGSAISRTTYAVLFSVISTTYGVGNGSTTFNIPDFRGRSPLGAGTGTATGATAHALGATPTSGAGGEEKHTLDITEIPAHTHSTSVSISGSAGAIPFQGGSSNGTPPNTGSSGGGLGHNIMSPNTAINFIIAQ